MKTEKDKMLSGDFYNPYDPQLSMNAAMPGFSLKNLTIPGPIKLVSGRASLKN
jgi:hypothetical protein